jgi:exodeoxyribonuclease VII large subunit
VLIVARGGGSMEDLWPFTEPPVAEAIHRCSIPVISAVGHETDVSISDFVADLRAPTPSAAAELAVPEFTALRAALAGCKDRLDHALGNGLRSKRDRLKLDWGEAIRLRLHRTVERRRQETDEARAAIASACERLLETEKHRLEREKERLFAYSPRRTLERGFALIGGENGSVLTSAREIEAGDRVSIRFADGTAQARITGKELL